VLSSDEKIFAEKTRELKLAQDCVSDLRMDSEELARRLSDTEGAAANLESQLLAKQIEVDTLNAKIQVLYRNVSKWICRHYIMS